MELEEAIKHAEEVAQANRNIDEKELSLIYCDDTECVESHKNSCIKCAEEHEQLAEWLRDYKKLKEQEPCEDCISRAEAMTEMQMNAKRYSLSKEFGGMGQVEWSDYLMPIEDALNILRDLPPVPPKELKTGHWIWSGGSHRCSNCNGYTCFGEKHIPNYCPNCGAKMEVEHELGNS